MHFSKIAATAVLAGSVLAHRPGVVNDYPAIKRRDLVARDCTRNNLLRALIRFSAEASPFCSEYLGGSAVATVTETVAGETTVEDTATVTGEPEVIVITDIGTITVDPLKRRQAEPSPTVSFPRFLSAYVNDTRVSSNCLCFLGTDIPAGTITATVTGPATQTVSVTSTFTLPGGVTTTTTFIDTITFTREPSSTEPTEEPTSEPTEEPTTTEPEPTSEPTEEPTTTEPEPTEEPTEEPTTTEPEPTSTPTPDPECPGPINGCVFGGSIIEALLISDPADCVASCDADDECVAFQIGRDEEDEVAYCETLNVSALEAYDEDGSATSAEYCSDFYIYDKGCPVEEGSP